MKDRCLDPLLIFISQFCKAENLTLENRIEALMGNINNGRVYPHLKTNEILQFKSYISNTPKVRLFFFTIILYNSLAP